MIKNWQKLLSVMGKIWLYTIEKILSLQIYPQVCLCISCSRLLFHLLPLRYLQQFTIYTNATGDPEENSRQWTILKTQLYKSWAKELVRTKFPVHSERYFFEVQFRCFFLPLPFIYI